MKSLHDLPPEEFLWMLCAGWLDRSGLRVVKSLHDPFVFFSRSLKTVGGQLCESHFAIDPNLRSSCLKLWDQLVSLSGTINTCDVWGEFDIQLVPEPKEVLSILHEIAVASHRLICLASTKVNNLIGKSHLQNAISSCLLVAFRVQNTAFKTSIFRGRWPKKSCAITDSDLHQKLDLLQKLQQEVMLEHQFYFLSTIVEKNLLSDPRFGLATGTLIALEWTKTRLPLMHDKSSRLEARAMHELLSTPLLSQEAIASLNECDETYRVTLMEECDELFRKASTLAREQMEKLRLEHKENISSLCDKHGVSKDFQTFDGKISSLQHDIFSFTTAPQHNYETKLDENLRNFLLSGFVLTSFLAEEMIVHAESFASKQWPGGSKQDFVGVFSPQNNNVVSVTFEWGSKPERRACLGHGRLLMIDSAPDNLTINHDCFKHSQLQQRKRILQSDVAIFFFTLRLPEESSFLSQAKELVVDFLSSLNPFGSDPKTVEDISATRSTKMKDYTHEVARTVCSVGFNYFGPFKKAFIKCNSEFEQQKSSLHKLLNLFGKGYTPDSASIPQESLSQHNLLTFDEYEKVFQNSKQLQGLENGAYKLLHSDVRSTPLKPECLDFPTSPGILSQLKVPEAVKIVLDKWAVENAGEFSIRTLDMLAEEPKEGAAILVCRQKGTRLNFGSLMVNSSERTLKLYIFNRTNRILTCWIDDLPDKSCIKASPKNWELSANSSHDVMISVDTRLLRKRNHLYKKFSISVSSTDMEKISVPILVEADIVFPRLSIKPGKLLDFGAFCSVREPGRGPELRLTSMPDKDLVTDLRRELGLRNDCKLELELDIKIEQTGNYFTLSDSKLLLPSNCTHSLLVTLNKGTPQGTWEACIKITLGTESFEVKVRATVKAATLEINNPVDLGILSPGSPTNKSLVITNTGDWPAVVWLKPFSTTNYYHRREITTEPQGKYVIPEKSTKSIPIRVTTNSSFSETLTMESNAPKALSINVRGSTERITFSSLTYRETKKFSFSDPYEILEACVQANSRPSVSDITLKATNYDGFDINADYIGTASSFTFNVRCKVTSAIFGITELKGFFRIQSSTPCDPLQIPYEISTCQPVMRIVDWKPIILVTKPDQKNHTLTFANSGNADLSIKLSVNGSTKELKISPKGTKLVDLELLDLTELLVSLETNEWSWDETEGKIVPCKKSTYSISVLRITPSDNNRVAFPSIFTLKDEDSGNTLKLQAVFEDIMATCSLKKNIELAAAVLAWFCGLPLQDLNPVRSPEGIAPRLRASNWNQRFLIDETCLNTVITQQMTYLRSTKTAKEGVAILEDLMLLVGCSSFAVQLSRAILDDLPQSCTPAEAKKVLLNLGGVQESKLELISSLLEDSKEPSLNSLVHYVDKLCKLRDVDLFTQLSIMLENTARSPREKVFPMLKLLCSLGLDVPNVHIAHASLWNAILDGTLTTPQLLERAFECGMLTVTNPGVSQEDFKKSVLVIAYQQGRFCDQMNILKGLSPPQSNLPDFNVDNIFEILCHFEKKNDPKLLELAKVLQEKHQAFKAPKFSDLANCKFAAALILFRRTWSDDRNLNVTKLCEVLLNDDTKNGVEAIIKFFENNFYSKIKEQKEWLTALEKYSSNSLSLLDLFRQAYSLVNPKQHRLLSLDQFLQALDHTRCWEPFVSRVFAYCVDDLCTPLVYILRISHTTHSNIQKICEGLRAGNLTVENETSLKKLAQFYSAGDAAAILCKQDAPKEKLQKILKLKIEKRDDMQACIKDLQGFGMIDSEILEILIHLPKISNERLAQDQQAAMLKALLPLFVKCVGDSSLLPLAMAAFGIASYKRDDHRLPYVGLMLAYSVATFENVDCPICLEKDSRQSHYCNHCHVAICSSCTTKDAKLLDCQMCKVPLTPVAVHDFGKLEQPPPQLRPQPNFEVEIFSFNFVQPCQMGEIYDANQHVPALPQLECAAVSFEHVDLLKELQEDYSDESSDDEVIEDEFNCDTEITAQLKAERDNLNSELKAQFYALSKLTEELLSQLAGQDQILAQLLTLRIASILTRAPQLLTDLQDILEKHIFRVLFLSKQIDDATDPSVLFSDWLQTVLYFVHLVQVANKNSSNDQLRKIRLAFGIGDTIELIERIRSMFKRLNIVTVEQAWLSEILLNLEMLHAVQTFKSPSKAKSPSLLKQVKLDYGSEPARPNSPSFVSATAIRQAAQHKQVPERQVVLPSRHQSIPGPSSVSQAPKSNAQIAAKMLDSHRTYPTHLGSQVRSNTSVLSPSMAPKYYNPPDDSCTLNANSNSPMPVKAGESMKMKITGDRLREILSKMESASEVSYSALELSQVTAGDRQAHAEHTNARKFLYVAMREKLRPVIETNTSTLVKSLDALRVDSREHVLNILFLLDNSGSMNFKDRMLRMKAALVVMLEACNNLGIHTAAYAIGKADDHYPLKHFDDPLSIKLGELILSGLTANSGSMIADGVQCAFTHIIAKRREQLSKECGRTASPHIMTILLTDGISGQLKERPGAMEMSAFQQTSVEYKRAGIPLTMVQIVDQKIEVTSLSKDVGAKSTLEDLDHVCSECGIIDWLNDTLSGKRDPTRRFFWPNNLKLAINEADKNFDSATTEVAEEEYSRFKKEAKDWNLHEGFETIIVSGMTQDKSLKTLAKLPAIDKDPSAMNLQSCISWDARNPPCPPFFLSQLNQICKDAEEFISSMPAHESSSALDNWNKSAKALQSEICHMTSRFAEMLPGVPSRKLVGNFDSGEEVNTMQFMELYWQNFPSLNYWLRRHTKTGEPQQRVAIVTCGADPELVVLVVEALKQLKLKWITIISADKRQPCLLKPPLHQAFDGNVVYLIQKLAKNLNCASMNTQGGLPDAIHFATSLLLNGPGDPIKQRPVLLTLGASGGPLLSPGCSEAISQAHGFGIQCMRIDIGRQAILGKALVTKNKDFPLFTVAASTQLLPHALQECLARENCTFRPEELKLPPASAVLQKKDLKELQAELPPAFKFDEPEFEIEVSQRAAASRTNVLSAEFDVVFVIDKTGSMSSYITACKEWSLQTAKTIREKMKESNVAVSLRMAVVFYSGYCCGHGPSAKVVGFGTPEQISALTKNEQTEGGCGHSADVWSGLRMAVDLKWRDKAQKMIFLIGDEPGHNQPGLWVNDIQRDVKNLGPSNPCGKKIITDMVAQGIQFIGPNILQNTDTMNKKFSSLYDGPGRQYQVKSLRRSYNPQEFTELVYDLVQSQLHNYVL